MEGKVRGARLWRCHSIVAAVIGIVFCMAVSAQSQTPTQAPQRGGQPGLRPSKAGHTREYRGQEVQGEERQIGRGDSLWRILVEEKGLPGKQFRSYLVVIRGLNPEVKNLDVLRVGDKIFIPLRTEDLAEGGAKGAIATAERAPVGRGATGEYRIKAGEHLYQILREQLKVSDERKVGQYYALVKDLNPERKNWDTLLEGEILRLPTVGRGQEITARAAPPALETKPAPALRAGAELKP